MITRRSFNRSLALAGVAGGAVGWSVYPAAAHQESGDKVSLQDLAKQGPLGDVVLGSPDAKVTIVEYASLTCSHCATFHGEVFPALKTKYIDTGKVRYTLREFPLDSLSAAGFVLSRCGGNDKYYAIAGMLFGSQKAWLVEKPLEPLQQLMAQAGFSKEKFESCLTDQKLLDGIIATRDQAAKLFNIDSTPTFFINGERLVGGQPLSVFEEKIDALLK